MSKYVCAICGGAVHEELRTLHEDAEQWLISRIKRQHPEWTSGDGACDPCIEAFRKKHGVTEKQEGR